MKHMPYVWPPALLVFNMHVLSGNMFQCTASMCETWDRRTSDFKSVNLGAVALSGWNFDKESIWLVTVITEHGEAYSDVSELV